jgi:hypothetical protein
MDRVSNTVKDLGMPIRQRNYCWGGTDTRRTTQEGDQGNTIPRAAIAQDAPGSDPIIPKGLWPKEDLQCPGGTHLTMMKSQATHLHCAECYTRIEENTRVASCNRSTCRHGAPPEDEVSHPWMKTYAKNTKAMA